MEEAASLWTILPLTGVLGRWRNDKELMFFKGPPNTPHGVRFCWNQGFFGKTWKKGLNIGSPQLMTVYWMMVWNYNDLRKGHTGPALICHHSVASWSWSGCLQPTCIYDQLPIAPRSYDHHLQTYCCLPHRSTGEPGRKGCKRLPPARRTPSHLWEPNERAASQGELNSFRSELQSCNLWEEFPSMHGGELNWGGSSLSI